jgi:hypothetical protein
MLLGVCSSEFLTLYMLSFYRVQIYSLEKKVVVVFQLRVYIFCWQKKVATIVVTSICCFGVSDRTSGWNSKSHQLLGFIAFH